VASRIFRNRLLLIIALTVAVFLGLARLAVREVSTGPLRASIEKNLTEALGLDVRIDELVVALVPTPHLDARGVRVANLPDREAPHLLRVERLHLGIEFWPLLGRQVVVDTIKIEGADFYVETDAQGRFAGRLHLAALVQDADQDLVELRLRRLRAEGLRVFYREGRDGSSYSLILDSVALASKALGTEIALEIEGQFEGSPIALSGRIGSLRELMTRTQPFPIDLHGQLFEAVFDVNGTIAEPSTLEGFEVEISGAIPRLVVRDHPLPQLGKIHFGGQLSDADGSLGFEHVRLDSTETIPVQIAVRGRVDDLLGLREIDVEVDVETLSLEFLRPLLRSELDLPLPTIDLLSVHLKLSDQEGRLDLDGVVHAVKTGDGTVIHAEGGVHDLTGVAKVDVQLDLQTADLTSITTLVPNFPTHGAFGPLAASGRLMSHEGGLAAHEIEVRVGDRAQAWVELEGAIADVVGLQDVELEVTFGVQSLHHLEELLEHELPRTAPLNGSAVISDQDGTLGFESVQLGSDDSGPIEIAFEARFDDLAHRDEIELELDLRAEDTRALGAVVGIELPVISPVEFHAEVRGSDERVEVSGLRLRLGETRLLGNLSGSFAPGTRPNLEARLTSTNVRLQDLALIPKELALDLRDSNVAPKREGAATLPFERLRDVDLDLGLHFDRLEGFVGMDGHDVGFTLRLRDGELVVSDLAANYQGGKLRADLHIDARTASPKLEVEIQAEALNIARLMSQFDEETEFSGILDIELDLRTRGNTSDSLRQSLSGSVVASMRDGNAASRLAREFVLNLTEAVFPTFRLKPVPNVGCAVVDVKIKDGIALVRTLLLQGPEVGVTGTGKVDLVQGLYDLYVVPTTTNPGILSVAPEVHVDGPLDDPVFRTEKRTLVTSFGRGLIKNVASVGSTLLRPLGMGSDRSTEIVENCAPLVQEAETGAQAKQGG
jgi:uncharacterized protein involved in outer membrane biogenesis